MAFLLKISIRFSSNGRKWLTSLAMTPAGVGYLPHRNIPQHNSSHHCIIQPSVPSIHFSLISFLYASPLCMYHFCYIYPGSIFITTCMFYLLYLYIKFYFLYMCMYTYTPQTDLSECSGIKLCLNHWLLRPTATIKCNFFHKCKISAIINPVVIEKLLPKGVILKVD